MVLIEELLTIPDECKVNDIIAKDVIFSEGGLKSSDKRYLLIMLNKLDGCIHLTKKI